MTRAGRIALPLVAVALFASLWFVHAPPRSPEGYREEAASTAHTLLSQVETARLWADAAARGEAFRTSAETGFEETERDARAAGSSFAAHDPPAGTDAVRRELSTLSSRTEEALGRLRVAAARGEWERVEAAARALPELADALTRFERRVAA